MKNAYVERTAENGNWVKAARGSRKERLALLLEIDDGGEGTIDRAD